MRTRFSFLALTLLLWGCSQPEFAHRDDYYQLEDYAQEYIDQVLTTHFGSPTDMVVWERLPLRQHFATGTVQQAAGNKIVLDLKDVHHEILADTEIVLFPEGEGEKAPHVWVESWDAESQTATLTSKLDGAIAEGTRAIVGPGQVLVAGRKLYAEHCLHCHGVAGDGQGPTAPYLNPKPRDYRRGVFKFTVTQASERASRQDLERIILEGIPGTYMPSFKLLTPDEMTALVEYVLWLSMRGETEYSLVRFLSDGYSKKAVQERLASAREKKKAGDSDVETYASIQQEFYDGVNDADEFPAELESMFDLMITRWTSAQEETALLSPQQQRSTYDAESIARGRILYLSPDLNCIACHGEAGYGDGPQTYLMTRDEYGNENPSPGLFDLWGNHLVPRDMHTGIYRGGRRPIDLYSRVHAGIKGTPMPAFGSKLDDQQIWDLVNYIYSLPFEEQKAGLGKTASAPLPPDNQMAEN